MVFSISFFLFFRVFSLFFPSQSIVYFANVNNDIYFCETQFEMTMNRNDELYLEMTSKKAILMIEINKTR